MTRSPTACCASGARGTPKPTWEYTPDGGVQQDVAYSYDLWGNIIGMRDKALPLPM
ncbi:MAG: hypothetical protein R2811_05620 [Flavobacteriales bacterium]